MNPLIKRVARRGGLLVAAGLLAGAASSASAAYPERAVTLVVTYPPGGTVDVVARLIGPKLAAELGQPVVIENRGGAGGMIGGAVVAKAQPDGYTLMLDASNHAQNPALHSKMQFDTLTAFAPVSLLLRVPNVLVVTPTYEVKTVADLIKLGQPGAKDHVYFASAGPGSAQHLAGELFNLLAKTQLQHVAYKGGGPAMIDVMSGQVPVMFASMGSAWQHVKNGKLRAVAVGGLERSKTAPDLPTIAESGVPGYETYEWNAVFAPAGTPPDIAARLSDEIVKVMSRPDVQESVRNAGFIPKAMGAKELAALHRADYSRMEKVVKEAGITAE